MNRFLLSMETKDTDLIVEAGTLGPSSDDPEEGARTFVSLQNTKGNLIFVPLRGKDGFYDQVNLFVGSNTGLEMLREALRFALAVLEDSISCPHIGCACDQREGEKEE